MKKYLLTLNIFAVLVALVAIAFVPLVFGMSTGSESWEWLKPEPQGNNISSVSFVSSSTGWAAGGGGLVMKTTDGGASWTEQIPSAFATPAYSCSGVVMGSGCSLRGVFFVDADNGWAVGDYGSIWKTTDGGATWADQHGNMTPSVSTLTLRSVHFYNSSTGVIVGDGITLYTTNGGTTWTKGTGTGTSNINSVQMLSAGTAIAVGMNSSVTSGLIYKTTDGGANWTAKAITGTARPLNSVSFSGASNGYAVGGTFGASQLGTIVRTTDGGETWQANSVSIPTVFTGVAIQGGDKLVTTGYSGNIRRNTVNIWTDPVNTVASGLATVTSGTTSMLSSIAFAPGSTNGFAGGLGGIVLASSDSGGSWGTVASGDVSWFYSSSFTDTSNGWVAGENGTMIHTSDGGSNWVSENAGINPIADIYGVNFPNPSLGFAVGTIPGSPYVAAAYKYSSGTWTAMTVPAGVWYLSEVKMNDDTHGWAVGESGVILGTSDGSTWSKTVTDASHSFNSIDTTSSSNGWAVGSMPCPSGCSPGQYSKGIILRYDGSSWTTLPLVAKNNVNFFTAIDMVDANTGWAVGYHSYLSGSSSVSSGRVYKTTDGGATWTEQTTPTSRLIAGVSMLNTSTGYLVADEGRVAKTINGGATWTIETAGVGFGLNNVTVVSSGGPTEHVAYAAGGNSAILKYTLDTTAPTVSSVQPSGEIAGDSTTITVNYSDSGSGIRTGSVTVTLDDSPLEGCTALAASVSCPASGLAPGPHTIGGSVADNVGNSSPISGSFTVPTPCVPARPNLTLICPTSSQIAWATYPDYLARKLSVTYAVNNDGSGVANNVSITDSTNTSGVTLDTTLPYNIGTIAGAGSVPFTLKYNVGNAGSFMTSLKASAQDECGTVYTYPA